MSEQFKNEPLLDRLTSALYSERGTYTATNAGADYYARKGRRIQNEKKLLEKFRECYEELTPIGDDYSPTDAHLAAQAQGFRNSREWEQSWREAFKILYELEAGRKPNTCEIKLINDTHDNNTYIGKWDGFFLEVGRYTDGGSQYRRAIHRPWLDEYGHDLPWIDIDGNEI